MFKAGDGVGERDAGAMEFSALLVAAVKSPDTGKPSEAAFVTPGCHPRWVLLSKPCLTVRGDIAHAALCPVAAMVIALIGVQPVMISATGSQILRGYTPVFCRA